MCCLLRNFCNLSYPKSSLSTGSSRTFDWYTDNSHPSGLLGQGIRTKEKDTDLEYPQTPVIITCDVLNVVCFMLGQLYTKKICNVFAYCFDRQIGFCDNYRHCKRHGSYTAWARHGMCELVSNMPCAGNDIFLCVLKEFTLNHIRQMTRCVCECLSPLLFMILYLGTCK
jgi:hypothetical protein